MEPLGRPLRFTADWGTANFYRVFGWIANGLYERLGRPGLCQVDTSQAWVDAIESVVEGRTDVTIATPAEFAVQAREGVAQFAGHPHPELRALALLPHDDAILFAVPDESPIRRIDDILRLELPIRLALPPDDGYCHAGWACQAVLDEHGLTREAIRGLAGEILYRERPHRVPPLLAAGVVDAVMNEAMMLPGWRDLAQGRPTRFLSIDDDVLDRLREKHRFAARTVHAGRLPGQNESIRTVDFSGWLLVTTEDLPEDVAHTITSVVVETRDDLERLYRHNPIEVSPLAYPVRPDQLAITRGVPLHDGARRYYAERGLLS